MGRGARGKIPATSMPPIRNRQILSIALLLTIILSFVVSQRLLTSYLTAGHLQVVRPSVSKETLFNYSGINAADDGERAKLRTLLNRTEGGKYTIKEVLFLRRPPPLKFPLSRDARNVAATRRRQNENAWMVPLTSGRFDPHVKTFYSMAKRWLEEGFFQPEVMRDLVKLVKEPVDRRQRALSNWQRAQELSPINTTNRSARYRSCAVVGNSGILLNTSYGEQIDSHEMVIRLNNARISGFEKQVGSKTSLAFMNSNILRVCSRRDGCPCHPYGENVSIMLYICQAQHLMDVALCTAEHHSPLLVTDGRLDNLCARIVKWYSMKNFVESRGLPVQEWDTAHHSFYFHYSSGFQAVVVALGICDRVDMFGFGKNPLLKHHYHSEQTKELSLHDYEAEYIFYDDLIHGRSIPFLTDHGISLPPVNIYY